MEQLTQNLKDGAMQLLEVPFPALLPGSVLVRNHFSVISTGTEGKSVTDARLNYFAKARSRSEEVGKVIKSIRAYGLLPAYRQVMNRLDAPSPLGYCCAGEIIAVASDVTAFKTGDLVACGGNSAVHAEVVCVAINLCTKIPDGVALKDAAFTTLGAIAMQGIRQADLRIGENAVVIGLGLIGQLTVQILNASGVRTAGIDVDDRMVGIAAQNGCGLSLSRNNESLLHQIKSFTGGHGTDAVIITAGTSSTDPVDLAGELCRKKGKVIIVGAVPTGFKRAPYFRKELDLRMSASYGPGRYDREYEEQGIDYPYAYVRWTENRNMAAFVELLRSKKVNPSGLITHEFPFRLAMDAYRIIVDKTEPYMGMVLHYDVRKELKKTVSQEKKINASDGPRIGFIGAGSFARNFLLPAVKDKAQLVCVATARPHNAQHIAAKYGFSSCTGDADDVINNAGVNTVFIATRHDSHAEYVLKALKHNKNVFVEKPLCLTLDELENIASQHSQSSSRLMLGFNRRFSPYAVRLKESLSAQPLAINYRINAGFMPADHWIHDPAAGGGRIVGEACHFIDFCVFLTGSKVIRVAASRMNDSEGSNDTFIISLVFADGSIASVSYFSNGNKEMPKERIEVFSSGTSAVLDDFSSLKFFGSRRTSMSGKLDKGHKRGVELFLESVKKGNPSPIPFDEIYHSTFVTFKVIESIAMNGVVIDIV